MATLEQIERALRAADAAGNTEDARRLAQAYAETRDSLAAPPGAFDDVQSGVSSTNHTGAAPASPGPKQRTAGQRFMREVVGLGTRNIVEGAADVAGIFYDPIADGINWLGEKAPTTKTLITGQPERYFPRQARARDVSDMILDGMGVPKPETAEERVAGDVGRGLSGTALTMGAGALLQTARGAGAAASTPSAGNALARVGDFLTAQPVQQAIASAGGSAASGVAREAGFGPGGQALAGLGGALTPAGLSALGAAGLRGLVRGRSGTGMQQTINDFASIGAKPSVGQASENRLVQGIESLLAGGPTSSGVMTRFAERQADDIGSGLQTAANATSRNASAERAGRAIERGADLFNKNTGAMRRGLYWVADKAMPQGTTLPMTRTMRALQELTTPSPGAINTTEALIQPQIRKMADNLSSDLAAAQANGVSGIPYDAVRRLRSEIGEQIGEVQLVADRPIRELRKLYATLSQDLEEAAKAAGPAAERAAKRANNYTRAVADRAEQVQRVIDKNGGPERVFSAAMSGTRDGGTTLRAVLQSLPVDGQRAVTAAVIKRMGMATPGAQDAAGEVFSASTFMTNWNRLSTEARRALFDRYGPGFTSEMDRIARVASNIKEGSKVYANSSGTANRAAAIGYGTALGGSMFHAMTTGNLLAPVFTVGSGVGANWMARAMTNPDFVSWLARSTALPVGSVLGYIQTLRAVGERKNDEDLVEAADALQTNYVKNQASDTSGNEQE